MITFFTDVLTVLRKELIELVGSRRTARGPLVQASITIVMAGVVIPMNGAVFWVDVRVTALLFFIFPSMLAASVAADAFAGERERRTLETLLATPLSDAAIFLGKMAAAVVFALTASAVALLAGFVTVNVHDAHGLFLPPAAFWLGVAGAAIGSSFTTSSIAVAVSMRVPVARSAQQIAAVSTMVLVGGVVTTLKQLRLSLDWALVLRIDVVVCAVGVCAVLAALRLFRRDRLLENR